MAIIALLVVLDLALTRPNNATLLQFSRQYAVAGDAAVPGSGLLFV